MVDKTTIRDPEEQRERLAFFLLKAVNKACRDFHLLEDGDRIAVAVSGGKDSCTLLELLRRRRGPDHVELIALHVVPSEAEPCGDHPYRDELIAWFKRIGVPFELVEGDPPRGKAARGNQSPCFHCAWRRRKALFQAAHRLGCNKLALAHHTDDVAATTLLNLFYQGRLDTMRPRVTFFDGAITVIRPLFYVEEKEIVRFARVAGFPTPPPPCAEGGERRALMERLIREVEATYPKVKINLWRAVQRCDQGRSEQESGRESSLAPDFLALDHLDSRVTGRPSENAWRLSHPLTPQAQIKTCAWGANARALHRSKIAPPLLHTHPTGAISPKA